MRRACGPARAAGSWMSASRRRRKRPSAVSMCWSMSSGRNGASSGSGFDQPIIWFLRRWGRRCPSKNSRKPLSKSHFVTTTKTGKRTTELPLDHLQLPGNAACLALAARRTSSRMRLSAGNARNSPLMGQFGRYFLKQRQRNSLPFVGRSRLDFLEKQPSSRVEDDGVIGEPPIHVDGAADTLEFILQSPAGNPTPQCRTWPLFCPHRALRR